MSVAALYPAIKHAFPCDEGDVAVVYSSEGVHDGDDAVAEVRAILAEEEALAYQEHDCPVHRPLGHGHSVLDPRHHLHCLSGGICEIHRWRCVRRCGGAAVRRAAFERREGGRCARVCRAPNWLLGFISSGLGFGFVFHAY